MVSTAWTNNLRIESCYCVGEDFTFKKVFVSQQKFNTGYAFVSFIIIISNNSFVVPIEQNWNNNLLHIPHIHPTHFTPPSNKSHAASHPNGTTSALSCFLVLFRTSSRPLSYRCSRGSPVVCQRINSAESVGLSPPVGRWVYWCVRICPRNSETDTWTSGAAANLRQSR